jgi:hypothetical protein
MIPLIYFGWETSKAAITIFSQTQKTGEILTYWNLGALLNALFPQNFSDETLNEVFSFPLVRYLWILGLMVGYLLYHKLQKNLLDDFPSFCSLDPLLRGYLFATIGFLLTRTFIPEQFVIYLAPLVIVQTKSPKFKGKLGWRHIWILALAFAFVNLYPFAFAYLINPESWYIFNYLAFTQPYSNIRYFARFAIAVIFDLMLMKILSEMVADYGESA